jgi:hypothetical protein
MKDIKGYEGLYAVTSCGKVWSHRKSKFLKPYNHTSGYLSVNLYGINRLRKTCLIHRLVAEAYLTNPGSLPQVNHKDENRFNNCVNNLEYSSAVYNLNYGTRNSRIAEALGKPVYCIELNVAYNSISEASKLLRISGGNISEVINGNRKTAGGYHWRWAD